MLALHFVKENDTIPNSDVEAYREIWDGLGDNIVQAYKQRAGFDFAETSLTATIHNGISQSHPFKLQASIDHSRKVGDLIHELGHVLIVDGPTAPLTEEHGDSNTRSHKALDLILYDVLTAVCGQDFADEQVEHEKQHAPAYKIAWEWALSMTFEERTIFFNSLKSY